MLCDKVYNHVSLFSAGAIGQKRINLGDFLRALLNCWRSAFATALTSGRTLLNHKGLDLLAKILVEVA